MSGSAGDDAAEGAPARLRNPHDRGVGSGQGTKGAGRVLSGPPRRLRSSGNDRARLAAAGANPFTQPLRLGGIGPFLAYIKILLRIGPDRDLRGMWSQRTMVMASYRFCDPRPGDISARQIGEPGGSGHTVTGGRTDA